MTMVYKGTIAGDSISGTMEYRTDRTGTPVPAVFRHARQAVSHIDRRNPEK